MTDDVKAVAQKILDRTADQIGTHSTNCHEYHLACFAAFVMRQMEAATSVPAKTVQEVLELLDAFHGDNRMSYDAYTNLHDAVALLDVQPVLAVDREALAAELYTAYTAKGWHRADEIERSDWRLVAQEVIDAGILRDVRDVQAEGADLAADWLAEQLWPDAADYAGHVRQFAQAIREARNER